MATTIPPSPGRIVLYYPGPSESIARSGGAPLAAIVCRVWSDTCINLTVFDANGNTHPRTSVTLVQPGVPVPAEQHCTWMPYQIGQAVSNKVS